MLSVFKRTNNIVLVLQIIALLTLLLYYNCDDNVPTLLPVTSSLCVKKYEVTNHFYVSYPTTAEILMCRCHCVNETALHRFGQAVEYFKTICSRHVKELRGFCFEKFQEKISCFADGFAYCFIKMSAEKTYFFRTFEFRNTMIRFTYDQREPKTVNVPLEDDHVVIDGKTYMIYVNGPKCDQTKSFIRFYENIRNGTDKWYENCKSGSIENKFTRSNQFNITGDFSYHKKLWSRVQFSNGVCNGDLSAFSFIKDNELGTPSCKKFGGTLDFHNVDDTAAFLHQNINVIVATFEKVKSVPVTTTKSTTYDTKIDPTVTTRILNDPTGASRDGRNSENIESIQANTVYHYIIITMLTIITGLITYIRWRQSKVWKALNSPERRANVDDNEVQQELLIPPPNIKQ